VRAHASEAGELVVHRFKMLKGPKRRIDQPEATIAEIERLHARTRQRNRPGARLAAEFIEHGRRRVYAGAFDPARGNRQQDPARAAAHLEHRSADVGGQLLVELRIRSERGHRGVRGVVEPRGGLVRDVDSHGDLCPHGTFRPCGCPFLA
jgi:hypothetical protein